MSTPHPVAAAIAALVDLVRAAAPTGVQVDDGDPLANIDEQDAIGIGVDIGDVAGATSQLGYAVGSQEQPFDLSCVVQSSSGDGDLAGARTRVFELVDVVAGVLAEVPQLGVPDVVWDARIASWSLRTLRRRDVGALAVVEFTVRVNTYRKQ